MGTGRSTIGSLSELPFDQNSKLAKHLLVYPEKCAQAVEGGTSELYARGLYPVSGEAQSAFFGDFEALSDNPTLKECRATCLERGTDRAVVHAALPRYQYDGQTEEKSIRDWVFDACQKVEFGFINYHKPNEKNPVNVYWVGRSGDRHSQGELKWGERNTRFLHTFLGHTFLFEDSVTKEILLEHTVEFTGVRAIGKHPSPVDPNEKDTSLYGREIHDSLIHEWDRHLKVKRTFTELGFSKGRLPDDVFASMGAYHYNNENYKALEEWDNKGVFVNWWEVDVFFIQAPWDLKLVWQTRIKELVEAWTNTELENTALYGMRRYEEGARLLTHVDRVTTHAASVIINVAQGNLSKPWTVEVHDHADRLHEVVMEPGDIVYYESAKCLHGRNTPLQGKDAYYVNMFSHYRPRGDADWYRRPNPAGTPDPLIDVGECRLVGPADQYSSGAVRCDEPGIGPHLSPGLFTAHNGEDLFEWWIKVGEDTETDAPGNVDETQRDEL